MTDLDEIRRRVTAAVLEHRTYSGAGRALGLCGHTVKAIYTDPDYLPGPLAYRNMGLVYPGKVAVRETTRGLPEVVSRWRADGRPYCVAAIARDAGCAPVSARRYLRSLGLLRGKACKVGKAGRPRAGTVPPPPTVEEIWGVGGLAERERVRTLTRKSHQGAGHVSERAEVTYRDPRRLWA